MSHSFAKPEGDGKLARLTFIAEAVMLPLAIKIGLAFGSEAVGSDSGAQSAITLARDALSSSDRTFAPVLDSVRAPDYRLRTSNSPGGWSC